MKWYHEQYNKVSSNVTSEVHRHSKYDSKHADKNIYHCNGCNRCWEESWLSSTKTITYYVDFPTYKKKKKACSSCIDRKMLQSRRIRANELGLTWLENQKDGRKGYYKTKYRKESEKW